MITKDAYAVDKPDSDVYTVTSSSLSLPTAPVPIEDMTQDDFDSMMEAGLSEAKAGIGMPVQDAFAELRRTV